ncbi:MAG: DUF4287 domain-containing protein [Candidatus Nanopelagicales bacterium]|nr:DUF4287 domain-containing protein [Candidatus Nanopelagicales bacterium]
MAITADRTSYFPLIEKRYGRPMSFWHEEMTKVADKKYPEQMAFLQNEHGFSRAHANALVQYSRGSHSSRRYETVDDYLAEHDDDKQRTLQAILTTIAEEFPESSVVIAWNHPMVMIDGQHVFGVSVHSKHLLLAPFGDGVIDQFRERLGDYELNKKTVKVPIDWQVDRALIRDMIDVHRS